jgi:hypothetical protein
MQIITGCPGSGTVCYMKVFFFFSVLQYHLESREVVRYFRERGAQCEVHLAFSGRAVADAREFYAKIGVPCTAADADFCYEEAQGDDSKPPQPITVEEILSRIEKSSYDLGRLAYELKRIGQTAVRYLRVREEAEQMLERIAPDVVFQGSFLSCGRLDNALTKLCHERGIPCFCLPYTPIVGTRLSMEGRLSNILCGMVKSNHVYDPKNWIHRFIKLVYPDWIHPVLNVPLMSFVDYEMLAAKLAGIGEPWPWQKPSLHFDAFFVWTEMAKSLAVEEPSRFPASKVHVFGAPRLDPVSSVLKNGELEKKVKAKLGISLPYVLLHIPPAFEHRVLSREDHFANVDMLCGIAKSSGLPVAIALHPLANTPDYLETFRKHGVAFDPSLDITELFPLASVVMAHPSSTNYLANIFAKPLVVYDLRGELWTETDWTVYAAGTKYRGLDEPGLRAAFAEAVSAATGVAETSPPPLACQKIYEYTCRRLGVEGSPKPGNLEESNTPT